MSPDTKTRLLASMNAGRLIVLCGAGLSMAAPSSLPSARTVAERCFDKHRLESDPNLDPTLRQDLEALAEHFAGQHTLGSIFIEHLVPWPDFVRPSNAGHAAVADFLLTRAAVAGLRDATFRVRRASRSHDPAPAIDTSSASDHRKLANSD